MKLSIRSPRRRKIHRALVRYGRRAPRRSAPPAARSPSRSSPLPTAAPRSTRPRRHRTPGPFRSPCSRRARRSPGASSSSRRRAPRPPPSKAPRSSTGRRDPYGSSHCPPGRRRTTSASRSIAMNPSSPGSREPGRLFDRADDGLYRRPALSRDRDRLRRQRPHRGHPRISPGRGRVRPPPLGIQHSLSGSVVRWRPLRGPRDRSVRRHPGDRRRQWPCRLRVA